MLNKLAASRLLWVGFGLSQFYPLAKRQGCYKLPSETTPSIGHGRANRWCTWLTNPRRWCVRGHNHHINLWHFIDAQDVLSLAAGGQVEQSNFHNYNVLRINHHINLWHFIDAQDVIIMEIRLLDLSTCGQT